MFKEEQYNILILVESYKCYQHLYQYYCNNLFQYSIVITIKGARDINITLTPINN